jgi:hypothetical protein
MLPCLKRFPLLQDRGMVYAIMVGFVFNGEARFGLFNCGLEPAR